MSSLFHCNDFLIVRSIVCALQGCSAVDDGRTGVLVGVWSHFPDLNGDGVKITTDGGRRWEQHNSDTGEATCRYGLLHSLLNNPTYRYPR